MLVGYRLYGIWWTAVAQVVSEVGRRSHCVAAGGSAREETDVMMLRIVTLRIASNGRLKGYMWCDCGAVQSVELNMVRSDCLVRDREQQTSKRGTEVFVFLQEIEINRRCLITNDRAGE